VANQSDTTGTITHSDGYVQEFNVYWDTADSDAPIVLVLGGSGSQKDDDAVTGKATSLRDSGFVTITVDYRGSDAGKTWIASNGTAEQGYGYVSSRDLADLAAIRDQVLADNGSGRPGATAGRKLAVAGTSRGATLAYGMAAVEGMVLDGIPMPRVDAICPNAFGPDLIGGYIYNSCEKPSDASFQAGSGIPSANGLGIYDPNLDGTNAYIRTTMWDALRAAWDEDDWKAFIKPLTKLNRENDIYPSRAIRKDLPVFASASYDDFWNRPDSILPFIQRQIYGVCRIGSAGNHGATDVNGESERIKTAQGVWLKHFLLGTGALTDAAATFTDDDPTKCAKVVALLVPNNDQDYADQTNAPGSVAMADTPYSWEEIYIDQPYYIEMMGNENEVKQTSDNQRTTLWLGNGVLGTSEPGAGSDTFTNTWGTATTQADIRAWIEAGNAAPDIDTYLSGRLTHDTIDYTATWSSSAVLMGACQLRLFASADAVGSQIYATLEFNEDVAGVGTWKVVSDAWYLFPDDYTPGDTVEANLRMSFRPMHLPSTGADPKIRVRIHNYSRRQLNWFGGETPVRFLPDFTSGTTVTIGRGTGNASRITLALQNTGVTRPSL
jgi:pimeloyl-ACP methyl ester carboxylesterase